MDVYCGDCKNYTRWYQRIDVCKLDVYKDEIGTNCIEHDFTCRNRNGDNKCKNFKPNILNRFKYRKLK